MQIKAHGIGVDVEKIAGAKSFFFERQSVLLAETVESACWHV